MTSEQDLHDLKVLVGGTVAVVGLVLALVVLTGCSGTAKDAGADAVRTATVATSSTATAADDRTHLTHD